MLSELIIIPFLLQGLLMMVDEFYYHRKRGLLRWERIGHPIDTLSVLVCFLFIFIFEPTMSNIFWYVGLSLFSCLLVTKDEFEHKKYCEAGEQWLHAVLFILHPIIFLAAGLIWYQVSLNPGLHESLLQILKVQIAIILLFLTYQITYWNFIWKTNPE